MSDEAVIKIRLDTRDAHADLRALVREGQRTAGIIGQNAAQGMGGAGGGGGAGGAGSMLSGLGGFGMAKLGAWGAAAAGAFAIGAPVLGKSFSTAGNVMSEGLGGFGGRVEKFLFGDLGAQGRAAQSAREQTIGAFGVIAGQTGQIPPGAQNFFNQVKALRANEEKGRELFENNDNFRGPGPLDLLDRLLKGVKQMFEDLGTTIVDALKFW